MKDELNIDAAVLRVTAICNGLKPFDKRISLIFCPPGTVSDETTNAS